MSINMNPGKQFLIVGAGASAGGLDAFQRFLDVLPRDFSFALVFIQHLSAKHKSLLRELLSARRPSLVIQEASDGLRIQPGRLYLSPPGKEVRLRSGLFQTTVHPEGLIHLPIDEFLSSLAEDAGERSVAVIFSGAGTDGARGCQAVRSVGGTVYVQDPQTAEFDGMPLAAIATGRADAVLSPESIVAELLRLQGIGRTPVSREYPCTEEAIEAFFRVLQEKTGSRFNHYKKSVVSRRINRRMYLNGLSTVKEYLDLVSTSDAEAALLASDLMIGVTSFFRDRVAWKALNLEAVRKITAENSALPVRVWTPASATGEEAYSIAMMFLHELALAGRRRDVQVFATDVNDRALERAREGRYPASITADVPKEYLQKYFTPTNDGNFLAVNKDVRESVIFARQHLLTDPPFSKLDLIICRNFMIYLEPEAQELCIKLFHYALNNGGYLFLGNAETVGRKSALFKSIGHKQCRVYRKLETSPSARLPLSIPYAADRQTSFAKQTQAAERGRSVVEIIQEKLLEEYGPASVAIDQHYEIIYHNGPTNRYLMQPRGVPTQNLLELVPGNLRSRIRGAIYRSGRDERPVVVRTSLAGDDGKTSRIILRISKAAENLSIVVFQEKRAPSVKEAAEQVDAAVIEETAIHQLESELSATRADLQSHIEQLKSMNEEFQSSNEELQAANEELETSREELQSLNEELLTVNSQLQGKIEEQEATNNDLNNFQASTNIPTIFLDEQFRVKRFTPAMLRLIQLLPSDVGRPIADLSQENLGPELVADSQTVLDSLLPLQKEIEVNGVWYIRATLPYRTSDNRIEGVVITYTDITERKRDEEIKGHLAAIIESADEAIMSKDLEGMIRTWNAGAEKIFGYTAQEAIGRNVSFLVPPGHVDEVPAILKRISAGEHVEHFETIRMRKDGTIIPVSLTFSPIRDASGRVVGVSKISHDISARLKTEAELQRKQAELIEAQRVTHIGSWYWDAKTDVTTGSDELLRIYGFDPATQTMPDFAKQKGSCYPVEDWERVNAAVQKAVQTGVGYELDMRVIRDNDQIWVTTRGEVVRDAEDRVIGMRGTVQDITERKKAGEVLTFQARLLSEVHDAVFSSDRNFSITYWNQAAEKMFGWTKEEVLGNNSGELLKPIVAGSSRDRERAKLRSAGHWEGEVQYIRKDGTYFFVEVNSTLLKDAQGKDTGNVIVARDITERKKTEEAIKASEERLRLAQQVARIGSFEWDLVKQMTVWSPELEALYGLRPGTICGRYEEFASRVHPDDLPETERRIREALDSGAFEAEWRVLWPDGTIRWMAARGQVFKDDTGTPLRMIGVNLDITERKQAEETLAAAHRQLQSVIDNTTSMVYACDLEGRFMIANAALAALLQTTPAQILGKRRHEFMPQADADKHEANDREVMATGRAVEFEEHSELPGRSITWLSTKFPLRDVQGRIYAVAGIVTDITERKKAEADILKLSEDMAARNLELELANKEMESFIYSISHDLRAPIRAMSGFAKILSEDFSDKLEAQGRDYVNRIVRGSTKATLLIDDLLHLSKISRQELDRIETDLSKKASKIVEELRETHHDRNVEVAVQEGLTASVDPRLIEVVLSNLLGNAWKFTSKTEKARIEFGAFECGVDTVRSAECGVRNAELESEIRNSKSAMVYFVRDNGAGFDMTYAEKMFWPFHRLHAEKDFEGTGIGLTIVERVIRRHGGRIWAEGEVEKGATFYFTL